MSRKKLQVSAFIGWQVNGNQQWDLIRAFNHLKIAEAWVEWHLANNTKRYDFGNYYHADSLIDNTPESVIAEQTEILIENNLVVSF